MNINGLNVNYLDYGNKDGKAIVLLHGWGQNLQMMTILGEPFKKEYRIIAIDFPGFGKSDEPAMVMDVGDYTIIVEELLKKLNVKEPVLVGHSFGGRVSVKFASRNKVSKVILLSPALRSHDKKGLKTKVLKSLKKVPGIKNLESWAKDHVGSRDYKAASPVMKQVLVKTVNEDLSEAAKKIKAPVILIYGDQDAEVPEEDTLLYESLIPDCGLIKYDGCTHYAYLERLEKPEGQEDELKCVARALLPPEIMEGSHLAYEMLQYTII